MVGITIYPNDKLKEKIKNKAREQGRSLNNLILFIVTSYFKKINSDKSK